MAIGGRGSRRLVALLACLCLAAPLSAAHPDPLCASPRPREPIQPLPASSQADPARARLGKQLFHDARLSHGNEVSCASCHPVQRGGADGRPRSRGVGGAVGAVNAPTVLNSGLNFRQFWDGRADSLETQIEGPLHHPAEMASSWPEVLGKLAGDAAFQAEFQRVYGAPPQAATLRDAIASYERSLITPRGKLDRYLCGDDSALSSDELQGYRLFKSLGCVSCHHGMNVGGNMYQRFGVMGDYFKDRGDIRPADMGLFNLTHREEDRHVFRVPSLRNVARTAPYFHDGSATTLADAVRVMGQYQLGRSLGEREVEQLVSFLTTLNGELP